MHNERFKVIDDTEYDDFIAIINELNFECRDFDLSEIDKKFRSTVDSSEIKIVPIIGDVIVKRKSTNVTRIYQAGDKKSWVADFQKELATGFFGNP
jgi:hypothetical protein